MRVRVDRSIVAALGVATALAIVLYAPAIFGGKVVGGEAVIYANPPFSSSAPDDLAEISNPLVGDSVFLYHPYLLFAREQIHAGELPLWNPRVGGGRPLGAGQGAPFFPLNWISYLLPFWPSLAWVAALKMVLAALGVFVFCRRRGLAPAAAVLGGIGFGFSTYYLGLLDAGQALAFGVLPWSLWALDRLLAGGRVRDALGLGAISGLILLNGHPESAALALAFLAAYCGFRLWRQRAEAPPAPRAGPLLAVSACVALAVGAIAIVSTVGILGEADSASRGGNERSTRILAGLFFPNYWGRPDTIAFPDAPTNFADRALYVGTLPLIVGIACLRLRRALEQAFFAVSAVLALALAVSTPLKDLVEALPGGETLELGHLNGVAVLSLAILAAFGLDRLLGAGYAERRVLLSRIAVVAALPLIAIVLELELGALGDALTPGALLGNEAPTLVAAKLASALRWGLLAVTAIVVLVALRRSVRWAGAIAVIVVGLTAIDLALIDRGYRPMVDPDIADPPTPASIEFLDRRADGDRIAGEDAALFPNLASRYELRDPRVEDLPGLDRYVDLITALGGEYFEAFGSSVVGDLRTDDSRRLLALFGVRYVLAGADQRPPPPGFEIAFEEPGQLVYEVQRPAPRAFVARDWVSVEGRHEALAAALEPGRPGRAGAPAIEGAEPAPEGSPRPAPATIVRDDPDLVEIRVELRRPGYLVLRDTIYPGWSASVDGEETEILPADVSFRSVAVPAGEHLVGFRYRPAPVLAAAAVSAAALVGAVIAIIGLSLSARPTATA